MDGYFYTACVRCAAAIVAAIVADVGTMGNGGPWRGRVVWRAGGWVKTRGGSVRFMAGLVL